MNKFFKIFINLFLLLTFPSLSLFSQLNTPDTKIGKECETTQVLSTCLFSYDDIVAFINSLETADLNSLPSEIDLNRLNCFIANLARQGRLSDINKTELENDIKELFSEDENPFEYSFYKGGSISFLPAVAYDRAEMLLCKGWLHKRWKHIKKFIKKHKKAIIIGAIVLIGTVTAVCIIASASTATAAAAGAGTAAAAASDKNDKEKAEHSSNPSQKPEEAVFPTPPIDTELAEQKSDFTTTDEMSIATNETPLLQSTMQEQISAFKESVVDDNLLNEDEKNDPTFIEQARYIGADFAHKTLDALADIAECAPEFIKEVQEAADLIIPGSSDGLEMSPKENYENIVAAGHEKIDQLFATDKAKNYSEDAKAKQKEIGSNDMTLGILPPPGNGNKTGTISKTEIAQEAKVLAEESKTNSSALNKAVNDNKIAKTIPNSQNISFTDHALQRASERSVSKEAIFDAVDHPLKIEEVKIDDLGRPSQRYIGKDAEVVINPDTKQVVSVNPTSTKKAEKLTKGAPNETNKTK